MTQPLSRRTLLKGIGTAIALPWLESMMPVLSLAGPAAKKEFPKRLAFFYVPNGVMMPDWTPTKEGTDFELPGTLKPLEPVKDRLLVMSGLTCDKARANGDGPGDHARAMSAFLTGCQAKKTAGADIRAGISADQVAAQKIGHLTKFPSLELGLEGGRQAGGCDSGYSCIYSSNLSWRSESTPMIKEIDPKLAFDRLFAGEPKDEAEAARRKREQYKKSVLDFVTEDANELRRTLGANDKKKVDEYLTGLRELELRIARAGRDPVQTGEMRGKRPGGVPQEYPEHSKLMLDVLALALQGDLTRVATFVFANEGNNRPYKFIDVAEGHHDLSHHGGDKEKHAKLRKINHFHMSQFAYLCGKLKEMKEGEGNVLDNCMFMYGSGNGDGNRHNHDELPIVLVGGGGGTLPGGQHIRYPRNTPITNLYLSLLDRMGAGTDRIGDSTERLTI
jgi:uncharacterized protein DUF1552